MPSLLLVVFILQLAIHLVNTFGASTINGLLWNLYNRFLAGASKSSAEQRELKAQFLKLRTELNSTSSQDEFAKWAKLRRQHDKVLEQLEKNKSSTDKSKATFDATASTIRWLSTNGLRMVLQWWCRKQPMFWIPQGWVPYYAEWLLSCPKAPLGSISIQVWLLACAAIITLINDALVAVVALIKGMGTSQKSKEAPFKVPADEVQAGEKAKKEL